MTKFLAIQNSYHEIELALFEGARLVDARSASKIDASKLLIPLLHSLLQKNSIALSELKFIAANRGPGPFTTLRTVLASVNGLSFASGVPLIGVDSLEAMVSEFKSVRSEELRNHSSSVRPCLSAEAQESEGWKVLEGPGSNPPLIALLNAFNQDVYFAISQGNQIHRGCQKIQTFLTELATTISHESIHFVGNGASMHQDLIRATFGDRALFDDPIPEGPSIETIASMALEKWKNQENLTGQLLPVYMK